MHKVDKEALKDGKVLQEMVNRFIEEPSNERMYQLLNCLTDCQVLIPCNARITENNQKIFEEAKVGDTITLADDLGFSPDNLISPDGHRYIPIFSNENKIDPEYAKHFSLLHLDVMNIMATYDSIKGEAEGLLLDYDIGIRGNLIELMKQMCIDKKSGEFYKDK